LVRDDLSAWMFGVLGNGVLPGDGDSRVGGGDQGAEGRGERRPEVG